MITSNKPVLIGIGGKPRSGKDSLAELFMERDFYGVSLGDIVRNHSRERHATDPDPISVANMTETANWLRVQHGADVVLNQALKEFEEQQAKTGQYKGLVLYSVRAPIEVDFILGHEGEVIWTEATDEVRHERMLNNLRKGEQGLSLEEFIRQENLQAKPQPGTPADAQMHTDYVREKATVVFENNTDDLEDFKRRGNELVDRFAA